MLVSIYNTAAGFCATRCKPLSYCIQSASPVCSASDVDSLFHPLAQLAAFELNDLAQPVGGICLAAALKPAQAVGKCNVRPTGVRVHSQSLPSTFVRPLLEIMCMASTAHTDVASPQH